MLITRRMEFSASHLTRLADVDDVENRRIYGESAHPSGHGHNYVMEVTLEGEPDPVTGMIVDLKLMKQILNEHVVDDFDHRFLNYEVKPFDQVVPTVENIAVEMWRRLEPVMIQRSLKLHQIRLFETPDLYVEYQGTAQ
jgi:6-pyruvoyltetrahydropterin/6-carboxytetrahydropterin synthase